MINSQMTHQFQTNKTILSVFEKKMNELLQILVLSSLVYHITVRGRWGTTDDFTTIPFYVVSSSALVELAKSIPVHSLTLSSHLFFCLPYLLFPCTVPCRIVFAKPEDLGTWSNQFLSFRFLTKVRSSSYFPIAAWIFL